MRNQRGWPLHCAASEALYTASRVLMSRRGDDGEHRPARFERALEGELGGAAVDEPAGGEARSLVGAGGDGRPDDQGEGCEADHQRGDLERAVARCPRRLGVEARCRDENGRSHGSIVRSHQPPSLEDRMEIR